MLNNSRKQVVVLLMFAIYCFSTSVFADVDGDYKQFVDRVTQMRDSGQITSLDRAKRMRQKNNEFYGPHDNFGIEWWTYFEYLASRRDQGMSQEEVAYLLAQKKSDIEVRRAQLNNASNEQGNAAKLVVYKRCFNKCMEGMEGTYATTSVSTYHCESECRRYK